MIDKTIIKPSSVVIEEGFIKIYVSPDDLLKVQTVLPLNVAKTENGNIEGHQDTHVNFITYVDWGDQPK